MNTDLLAADSAVSKIALVKAAATTATGSVACGYDATQEREVVFAVVDSRPQASDQVGVAVYTLAKRLRATAVRAVAYATEGSVTLVWTFIPERDKAARRAIYNEERQLMAEFPGLTFDFNVLSLDRLADRPFLADDIQGQLVYYRGPK